MNIEIILIWLLTGIVADFLGMIFVWRRHISGMKKIYASYDRPYESDEDDTFIASVKRAPWFAHAGLILIPPSLLLLISEFSEGE